MASHNEELFGFTLLFALLLLALFWLPGCSLSVPVKGSARVDTSGEQKLSGSADMNIKVTLNIDIASQVAQICQAMTPLEYNQCEAQVVDMFNNLMKAAGAGIPSGAANSTSTITPAEVTK